MASFGDFLSNTWNSVRAWSNNSSERKLQRYQIKRAKRRYVHFNDENKHPHIYNMRVRRDQRFYSKLRLPPPKKGIYYVPGQNKFFGAFYNANSYVWYEILTNWLIFLSLIFVFGYAIGWGVNRTTNTASINALTISEIVGCFILVVSVFLKIYCMMFPPKKLFLQDLQTRSSQQTFGGTVRKKGRR